MSKPRDCDQKEAGASMASGPQIGAPPPSEWWLDRSVAQRLYALLEARAHGALEQAIEALDRTRGDGVILAEAIFLLTQLKLAPAEAQWHWPRVRGHTERLAGRLECPIDLRVGLLSYFLDVNRQLEQPTIVEMGWIERARASAYLDELTGLPNLRFFREELRREIDRSLHEGWPLSLILIDLDNFKAINDRFGHEAGNAVLFRVAQLLRETVDQRNFVARYGGDEFTVLLPSTRKTEAWHVADAVRAAVASPAFDVRTDPSPFLPTVSLGIATCPADAPAGTELTVSADRALYDAKAAGKNRVVLYGDSTRSYARRRVACHGRILPVGALEHPIEVVAIGQGGLAFRSDQPFALQTLVEATVALPNGADCRVAGRIAWCRCLGVGQFETAIRFVEQDTALRSLGAVADAQTSTSTI